MSTLLIFAIIFITIALVGYTWSIFRMRRFGSMHVKTLVTVIVSWCCDFTGTLLFYIMGKTTPQKAYESSPLFIFHTWLGYLALLLMLIMVILVIRAYRRDKERLPRPMLNYALVAWIVWVIDYLTGMMVH
ncbi:hypothetical protein [Limosilactobacillus sp.]|uniref:hypothetical protein n=1 Tax=Limosilactobacillus sp. TaxID=2773925 RepID=UPI00345EBEE4